MSAQSSPQAFTDVSADPFVRGFLPHPDHPNGNGLVLTHGAGSNAQAPLLIALAETFCQAGFLVLRCDLPYRQDRSYGPPGPGEAKRDRAGLKNALAAIRKMVDRRMYLGGHSYGGRQSSMLCSEQPEQAAGLLLLSYPLHPPRKPEQLRTQHFFDLRTPTLFIEGTRDPFGSIEEMEQAIKLIPAKTKLVPIDGAAHDLGFKRKANRQERLPHALKEFHHFLS